MKKTFWLGMVVAGLVGQSCVTANANLVVNGSFEDGSFDTSGTGWSWNSVPAGDSTKVVGWTAINSGFDWHRSVEFGPAYEGDKMIDLTYGTDPGGIQQILSTTPGARYRLTFALAAPGDLGGTSRTVTVGIGGATTDITKDTSANHPLVWVTESLQFTAVTDQTTLSFTYAGSSAWGPVIDDVSVDLTAVPEPSTVIAGALLLLPFGVSTLRNLRKNRA